MNRLPLAKQVAVVAALVEGNSIRSTARMTDVSKPTILKLLAELGAACATYHDERVRNLSIKNLECDEIWAFVGAKSKNATPEQKADGWGDIWTWTAIDADTKLIASYLVGPRIASAAREFMWDVAGRITGRPQVTTDGLNFYPDAIEWAFGSNVDYAILEKHYRPTGERGVTRYSPGTLQSVTKEVIRGLPNRRRICTSFVERQNLSMRMSMRRFTRLTNGFSKKVDNHAHAVALYFLHYNFARVHKTLRVTPAMASGLADHVWSIEEIVGLLNRRGALAA